ncbi:BAR domain-containing protein [Yamadazyma tenuis]|uniref:Golgi vesicle protein n=1 Tax=Candida tenuis (strain ATCC 10573 / BCRC 21748 / CBS 615 / JCM 9827 / NBRC 10315 / NRRL Y-1498 / VKM Y-70) TaxID=590646 RepID=G3B2R0_CANTC|nr:Golgi vesicle protein [Yamadazyma tenuis ATCC 10573]EGV64736.1 Golgi vesicle protein [Yamadazyma tenuis ATCC 10573]WEJ97529.1 BAR domain-containing protein [Yamadazyma tenuis]
MSFNFTNFTKDLKNLSDKVTSEFNNEVVPFAQRTSRLVQERIGRVNVDEISQLPSEYTDLANKCNNVEKLYKNVLKITATYESESYDYPSNVQESFQEFSKNITTRVQNLSKATTPAEAQAALISDDRGEFKTPKTLYHALARATDASVLTSSDSQNDPLVKGLDLYSSNLAKIGNARLGQDQLIQAKFNNPLTTTLRSLISQSNSIQKKVEQKRLSYDLARISLTNCTNPSKEPQLRVVMENAEDDFANTVEDAISIMQNVLENARPLEEFLELIRAQLAYHKLATELLGGIVGDFESLIDDNSKASGSGSRESGDFDI